MTVIRIRSVHAHQLRPYIGRLGRKAARRQYLDEHKKAIAEENKRRRETRQKEPQYENVDIYNTPKAKN